MHNYTHIVGRAALAAALSFGTLSVGPAVAANAQIAASVSPERVGDSRVGQRRVRGVHSVAPAAVTVATIDTGVRTTHVAIAGRLAEGGYNALNGSSDVTDVLGHGTLVASILAGRASGSPSELDPLILPVRVFDSRSTTDDIVAAGLRYSIGRAPIANLSLAAVNPVAEGAVREAVASGQLLVIAAGNRAQADPDWPARFARETWAGGRIIAVGAVDGANTIASYSNRAGDTRDAFLVAPGSSIVGASSASDTGLSSASGTSVAAPQVARVAAMVKALWPQLSAQQVAAVLLTTARDLGAPGTDEIYGRGLLDRDAALSPVGITRIPTARGAAIPVSEAVLAGGPVLGAALRTAAAEGRLQGVALDSFGRQFYYDFGVGVGRAPALTLDRIFGAGDRQLAGGERVFANGARLTYLVDQAHAIEHTPFGAPQLTAREALAGAALRLPLGERFELAAGTLGLAGTYFGVGETTGSASGALAQPLFALVPAHTHLAGGLRLSDALTLKAGVLSTAANEPLRAQYGWVNERAPRAQLVNVELGVRLAGGWIGLSAAQLDERGRALGLEAGEAFAPAGALRTQVATLQAAWPLSDTLALVGQASIAHSGATAAAATSLVSETSAIRSTAAAIGLVQRDAWRSGDRVALTVGQPLRAASGSIRFDLPVDVDAEGNILRSQETIGLRPSGRERATELAYSMPFGRAARLSLAAIHRHQPNHDAAAPSERVVAVRYTVGF